MPYTAKYENCTQLSGERLPPPKETEYKYFTKVNNVKDALQKGPLSVDMFVNQAFSYYKTGIFTGPWTQMQGVNHVVALVGFGKDATTGQEYWII